MKTTQCSKCKNIICDLKKYICSLNSEKHDLQVKIKEYECLIDKMKEESNKPVLEVVAFSESDDINALNKKIENLEKENKKLSDKNELNELYIKSVNDIKESDKHSKHEETSKSVIRDFCTQCDVKDGHVSKMAKVINDLNLKLTEKEVQNTKLTGDVKNLNETCEFLKMELETVTSKYTVLNNAQSNVNLEDAKYVFELENSVKSLTDQVNNKIQKKCEICVNMRKCIMDCYKKVPKYQLRYMKDCDLLRNYKDARVKVLSCALNSLVDEDEFADTKQEIDSMIKVTKSMPEKMAKSSKRNQFKNSKYCVDTSDTDEEDVPNLSSDTSMNEGENTNSISNDKSDKLTINTSDVLNSTNENDKPQSGVDFSFTDEENTNLCIDTSFNNESNHSEISSVNRSAVNHQEKNTMNIEIDNEVSNEITEKNLFGPISDDELNDESPSFSSDATDPINKLNDLKVVIEPLKPSQLDHFGRSPHKVKQTENEIKPDEPHSLLNQLSENEELIDNTSNDMEIEDNVVEEVIKPKGNIILSRKRKLSPSLKAKKSKKPNLFSRMRDESDSDVIIVKKEPEVQPIEVITIDSEDNSDDVTGENDSESSDADIKPFAQPFMQPYFAPLMMPANMANSMPMTPVLLMPQYNQFMPYCAPSNKRRSTRSSNSALPSFAPIAYIKQEPAFNSSLPNVSTRSKHQKKEKPSPNKSDPSKENVRSEIQSMNTPRHLNTKVSVTNSIEKSTKTPIGPKSKVIIQKKKVNTGDCNAKKSMKNCSHTNKHLSLTENVSLNIENSKEVAIAKSPIKSNRIKHNDAHFDSVKSVDSSSKMSKKDVNIESELNLSTGPSINKESAQENQENLDKVDQDEEVEVNLDEKRGNAISLIKKFSNQKRQVATNHKVSKTNQIKRLTKKVKDIKSVTNTTKMNGRTTRKQSKKPDDCLDLNTSSSIDNPISPNKAVTNPFSKLDSQSVTNTTIEKVRTTRKQSEKTDDCLDLNNSSSIDDPISPNKAVTNPFSKLDSQSVTNTTIGKVRTTRKQIEEANNSVSANVSCDNNSISVNTKTIDLPIFIPVDNSTDISQDIAQIKHNVKLFYDSPASKYPEVLETITIDSLECAKLHFQEVFSIITSEDAIYDHKTLLICSHKIIMDFFRQTTSPEKHIDQYELKWAYFKCVAQSIERTNRKGIFRQLVQHSLSIFKSLKSDIHLAFLLLISLANPNMPMYSLVFPITPVTFSKQFSEQFSVIEKLLTHCIAVKCFSDIALKSLVIKKDEKEQRFLLNGVTYDEFVKSATEEDCKLALKELINRLDRNLLKDFRENEVCGSLESIRDQLMDKFC